MLSCKTVAWGLAQIAFRIFISSPGDVESERAAVGRVVDRLNAKSAEGDRFEMIRWEDDYYTADATFQDQIVRSADCDIVLCIFWKRLGSPLPDQYRRADGTNPTGTEFEFEMAIEAAVSSEARMPSLLVYRKTTEVFFSERDFEVERDQFERFKAFWAKWFRNEKAHFTAGFHTFDGVDEFEAMIEAHIGKWLKDQTAEVTWTDGSPFAGLQAFDADRSEVFFGRGVETDRVRARFIANAVGGLKFLLVEGPSGSGKSSLVRAGLVPRLRVADPVTGLPDLSTTVEITPASLVAGGQGWPMGLATRLFGERALEDALVKGDYPTPEALARGIEDGRAGAMALRGAQTRMSDEAGRAMGLLLVLDQLEELFDWPPDEAAAFAGFLGTCLDETPLHAVATMRSEYMHQAAGVAPLAERLGLVGLRDPAAPLPTIALSAPGPADLRMMITGPAEAAGLIYEGPKGDLPPLARRIEAEARATALPALQLLLAELYDRREGAMMTHAAFDTLGGVSGVMATRGDEVLKEASAAEQAAFPALARRLVRHGGEDAPVVSKRAPWTSVDANPAAGMLARRLMNAGLILGDDTSIRLAHEALIGAWDKLRDFVAAERRLLVIRDRLLTQFRAYSDAGRPRAGLLSGLALDEAVELRRTWGAEELEAQGDGVADYVTASVRARHRARGAWAVAALVALALLGVAGWLYGEQQRERLASATRASLLAVAGELRAKQAGYRQRAASEAQAALDAMQTPETLAAGISALMVAAPPHSTWRAAAEIDAMAYRPDGRLLSVDRAGGVSLDEATLGQLDIGDDPVMRIAPLSGEEIVVVTSSGRIGIARDGLGAGSAAPFWTRPQPGMELAGAGQVALHAGADRVTVWLAREGLRPVVRIACRLEPGPVCRTSDLEVPSGATFLVASPDGAKLAIVGNGPGEVLIYDGTGVRKLDVPPFPASLAWHDGGTRLGVGGSIGGAAEVRFTRPLDEIAEGPDVWDDALPPVRQPVGSQVPVKFQVPSPDGRALAVPCWAEAQAAVCVADLGTGAIQVLFAPNRPLRTVRWSPDGTRLSALLQDGGLAHWQTGGFGRNTPVLLTLPEGLTALAQDNARGRIALGTAEGRVVITGDGATEVHQIGQAPVAHLAFDGDGTLAVAHGEGAFLIEAGTEGPVSLGQDAGFTRIAHLAGGGVAATRADGNLNVWSDRAAALSGTASQVQGRFSGVVGDAAGGVLVTARQGQILRIDGGVGQPALDPPPPADISAGRSFDLHPNGRDLAVSRGDGGARIFDLDNARAAILLPTAAQDTNVVRFSPDGTRIAVLGADGFLHIWALNLAGRTAELHLSMQPVPDHFKTSEGGRGAVWMDWSGDDAIVVATQSGRLLEMPVNIEDVAARLARANSRE